MFCTSCGGQVGDGVDVCPKCGVALGEKGKAKLGITIGLLGAAIYFTALFNSTALILLAGYVLLFESNTWIKKTAVKAIVIVFSFILLREGISILSNVFNTINVILGWIKIDFRLDYPFNLDSLILYALSVLEALILVFSGFKALKKDSVKVNFIDTIVEKNM